MESPFFEKLLKSLSHTPSFVSEVLRENSEFAKKEFERLGFPPHKHEEWRYSPVKEILKSIYTPISLPNTKTQKPNWAKDTHYLTLQNGYSTTESIENEDFEWIPIEIACQKYSFITAHFNQKKIYENGFTALSAATSLQNTFILLIKKEGKFTLHNKIEKVDEALSQPRVLIYAQDASEASIIEFSESNAVHSLTNLFVEIIVNPKAKVNYTKVQNLALSENYYLDTTKVSVEKEAYCAINTFTLQGFWIRNQLDIAINGSNAEVFMNGLYCPKTEEHIDNHTSVNHTHPHTQSNELYKGLLAEQSTGVFNGKIFVQPLAQKTNAFQSCKNILLSSEAKMNAKPQLEIWADDVKCSHGMTIGKLDTEALFYLRSRGIPHSEAQLLLMQAFIQDVIETCPNEELRNYLKDFYQKKLA